MRLARLAGVTAAAALALGCPEFGDAPNAPLPEVAPQAAQRSQTASSQTANARPPTPARPSDPILRRLAAKPLRYTRHGRCRMACRHISEDEVETILETGEIARNRTRNDGRCISYAVEGHTADGQDVRIVYADCERETRVVTTIDLSHDWPCSCP